MLCTHWRLGFGKVYMSVEKNSYILVPCLKSYRKRCAAILKRRERLMHTCLSKPFKYSNNPQILQDAEIKILLFSQPRQ